MSNTENPMPAQMNVKPVKKTGLSLVWLVPIIALGASLWVAWQSYADQGALITIRFEDASGVKAGETTIKYRDVTVGRVESIAFSPGFADVLVQARVDKDIAPYLDDDAQFWVVRPDVSLRGVTGLETVLSGVFIEGTWDDQDDVAQNEFTGLDIPPLTLSRQRGTEITLKVPDGSAISTGAPILHKGIKVGYLETPELAPDGSEVFVNGFIEAPYDRRVTTSSRFWDTSGFSISLGAGGVSLDVNSLASLIEGGVAFDTIVSGGERIRDGARFSLFTDEATARESLFADPDVPLIEVAALFSNSVNGLAVGSGVRFRGIRIGEVGQLNAIAVGEGSSTQVELQVTLSIDPGRLGMTQDASTDQGLQLLSDLVDQGLRARLTTGNILTGALVVELVEVENPPPGGLDIDLEPYPLIPTTTSKISDVAASAEDVLQRINDLPVEELMGGAIDLMDSIERLANDENLVGVPAAAVGVLDDVRALITSDDIAALPAELRNTVTELGNVISSVSDEGIIGDLDAAIASVSSAGTNIEEATQNLPDLIKQFEDLTAKANALELNALIDNAADTLASIDSLVGSEATANLPASVSAALDEARLFLAEVRRGGAIENVNAALASANEAARAIEQAANSLPGLSSQANRLVTQTEAVIESYSNRSRFGTETLSTLRGIQEAADAISDLARTIQRNPNALLTGR